MLMLMGVGAGVLFSGYSQILQSNVRVTNTVAAKNDITAAANTLSASAVYGSDGTTFCPPRSGTPLQAGGVCDAAPQKMIERAAFLLALTNTAQLPSNFSTAGNTASPLEVGVFAAGAGLKQLDPWGHYYIYCRWEKSRSDGTNPAIAIISAGPDKVLQTSCANVLANGRGNGDDIATFLDVGAAVNRTTLWQATGTTTSQVSYGVTGSQVIVGSNGSVESLNLVVSDTATINNLVITSTTQGLTIGGGASIGSLVLTGSPLAIQYGGTGATTAAVARTNLGLGSMAVQNANAVAITGGSMSSVAITGGSIDGTPIGASTPSTVAATTVTATTITATGVVTGSQLKSTVATGTAPLVVTSTTRVDNLNSQYLGVAGQNDVFFRNASNINSGTLGAAYLPAFTGGDVTSPAGSAVLTLIASGVTAGTYGSPTVVPVLTIDAKGRVTSASNTVIAITDTQITGGVSTGVVTGILPISKGGTGVSSLNFAWAQTNLGLGTIATQNANAVNITGGTITGISSLIATSGTFNNLYADSATFSSAYISNLNIAGLTAANATISGSLSVNGAFVLTGTGTANYVTKWATDSTLGKSILYDSGAGIGIGTTAPLGLLQINSGTGAASLFVSATNGNVGIGTTSPGAYRLNVVGTSTAPAILAVGAGSGGLWGYDSGGIGVRGTDGGTGVGGYFASTSGYALLTGTGNVGIGTTAPTHPLEVYGTASMMLLHLTGTTTGLGSLGGAAGSAGDVQFSDGAGNMAGDQNFVWDNANKRLGIGTSVPSYALDVIGTIRSTGLITTTATFLGNISINGTMAHTGTGTTNYITKWTGTTSLGNAMLYDTGTGVGVGTTAPAYTLDVNGSLRASNIVATTATIANLAIGNLTTTTGTTMPSGTGTASYMAKWISAANIGASSILYDSGTSIGIGTTSPISKLHVSTVGASVDNAISIDADAGNISNLYWRKAGVVKWGAYVDASSNDLKYYDGTADRVTFRSGGNVGIGTVSPNSKLYVAGGGWVSNAGSSNNSAFALGAQSIGADAAIYSYGSICAANGSGDCSGTGGIVLGRSNTTAALNLTTGSSFFTGNVGIGTTAPGNSLDVRSPSSATISVSGASGLGGVYISGTARAEIALYDSGAGADQKRKLIVSDDGLLKFGKTDDGWSTNTYQLVIDNAGNVGIGTASPAAALEVVSGGLSTQFRGNSVEFIRPSANYIWADTAGGYLVFGTNGRAINAANANFYLGTDQSTTFNGAVNITGALTVSGATVPAGSGTANYVTKWATASTFGNSVIYDNGTNVGIGTTSPGTKLEINGSVRGNQAGALRIDSGNGYVDVGAQNAAWSHFQTDRAQFYFNKGVTVDAGGAGYNLSSYNTQDLLLATNGTVRMTLLNSSGYVGIGTTAPGSSLQINTTASAQGALRIYNTSGAEASMAYHGSSGNWWVVGAGGWGNTGSFVIGDGTADTPRLVISSSGNVGIGTTTPAAKLDINAGTTLGLRILTANESPWGLTIRNATATGNGFQIYQTNSGPTQLWNNYGTGAYITLNSADGNLGIGTASPAYKLDVNGAIRMSGGGLYNSSGYLILEGSATDWIRISQGYANFTSGGTAAYGPWAFGQGGVSIGAWNAGIASGTLYVSTSVGIGSTAPVGKLDIKQGSGSGVPWASGLNIYDGNYRLGIIEDTNLARFRNEGGGGYQFLSSGASVLVHITDGGSVGILTSSPAYTLHVNGTVSSTGYYQSSDSRLKQDVKPVAGALEKLMRIQGVSFQWKKDKTKDYGVIAQSVEKVFPELVSHDNEGIKSVKYNGLSAPIIEAIRELKDENNELRAELAQLRAQKDSGVRNEVSSQPVSTVIWILVAMNGALLVLCGGLMVSRGWKRK
jgi:hypothetical protein